MSPNWPDLRRDCDVRIFDVLLVANNLCPNWPDLRRDCDLKALFFLFNINKIRSELTWFTKGLRLLFSASHFKKNILSELTWFTKGLRLNTAPDKSARVKVRIDLIYEGIATFKLFSWICIPFSCPNWPDLRRDCDLLFLCQIACVKSQVRIDLIYEGIATTRGWIFG